MPAPSKEEVSTAVCRHIALVGGLPPSSVKPADRLKEDLGFGEYMRGAFAPGFQRIARKYAPEAKVTMAACKKLKTVQKAIDLVFKAAGGT
jgi:hypothetical protein